MRLHCALLVRDNIWRNRLAASLYWQKRNNVDRVQINERSGEFAPPSVTLHTLTVTPQTARMRQREHAPQAISDFGWFDLLTTGSRFSIIGRAPRPNSHLTPHVSRLTVT